MRELPNALLHSVSAIRTAAAESIGVVAGVLFGVSWQETRTSSSKEYRGAIE
jgi:hypothetical protein